MLLLAYVHWHGTGGRILDRSKIVSVEVSFMRNHLNPTKIIERSGVMKVPCQIFGLSKARPVPHERNLGSQ